MNLKLKLKEMKVKIDSVNERLCGYLELEQCQNIAGRVVSKKVFVFCFLIIFIGGYLLSYGLFFKNLDISKIGSVRAELPSVDFIYNGVSYFQGKVIKHNEKWRIAYKTPRIVQALSGKELEIFIEVPLLKEQPAGGVVGEITIAQKGAKGKITYKVTGDRNQRFRFPWRTISDGNVITVSYTAGKDYREYPVNFSLIVASFPSIAAGALLVLVGFTFFLLISKEKCRSSSGEFKYILLICLAVLFAYWLHSGAFISLELFGVDVRRVFTGQARHLNSLFENGHALQKNYRSIGATIIPFFTFIVEGGVALNKSFFPIYPTQGYLLFVSFVLAAIFLVNTLSFLLGRGVAIICFILIVTFFPFMADLYGPDSDALLIIYFMILLSLYARMMYLGEHFVRNSLIFLLVFFMVGATKVTLVLLALFIPIAIVYQLKLNYSRSAVVAIVIFMAMYGVFSAGKGASDLLQHPDRNVGIEGEPFQETVAWHMVWAANGAFDHHSAHWFTKSGGLRNTRVSEKTGLLNTTYLRQSQSATDLVYKPGVQKAFDERPGYFYSTAFLRMHLHGLKFYRYTFGGSKDRVWDEWLADGFKESKVVSGIEIYGLERERNAIRYDTAWKISPILFFAKITQSDVTFLNDLVLLGMSFIGLLLLPYRGLKFLLLACILSQILFSSGIHGINRYFMFSDTALLIGLAFFLHRVYSLLKKGSV
jgi:hypothetical protein